MQVSTYAWNKTFRERIIALCFIPEWFTRYGNTVVIPEYFATEEEQMLVEFLLSYHKTYNRLPDDDEIMAEFADNAIISKLVDNVFELLDDEDNLDYAESMAIQFAQEQAAKIAVLECMDDIERGILSSLRPRIESALRVGQDLSDVGISVRDDAHIYLVEDPLDDIIPTGIYHLDLALNGGLARAEFGYVMGPSNVGKTYTLVNFGMGAASRLSRKPICVTHLTFEVSAEKAAARYAARITGRGYEPIRESLDEYLIDFERMGNLRLNGKIRIKHWPAGTCGMDDVKRYLDKLSMLDYNTDLLIVDYPDLMMHERIGEFRHNLAHTATQLSGLVSDRNMAGWGAAQSTRTSYFNEIVDLSDVAEDINKVRTADVVLTLNQSKEEYDLKQLRIFGAKNREGAKYWIIYCSQLVDSHSLESYDVMTWNDYLQAESEEKERRKREAKERYALEQEAKQIAEAKQAIGALK